MEENKKVSEISELSNLRYKCPKHGLIENNVMTVFIKGEALGTFCVKCWAEMLENNLPKLEIIKSEEK